MQITTAPATLPGIDPAEVIVVGDPLAGSATAPQGR